MISKFRNFMLPAVLLALTASLGADAPKAKSPPPPAVGDIAKDFTLKTIDGKEVKLSELTKTGPVAVVVLRGWVTYQCPLCTKQVANFASHAQELEGANIRVVFVYPGPADVVGDKAKEFRPKDFPASFQFVIDPDLKFVKDWNLHWDAPKETAYPSTFLVDQENKIKYAKVSKGHGNRAGAAEILAAVAK
jgi:peroxiredoxin